MAAPHRASLTMRVDRATRLLVDEIAHRLGTSMQEVVAQAVEAYRRQLIVEEANSAYARVRADAAAQRALAEERSLFEQALGDGIDNDPYPL